MKKIAFVATAFAALLFSSFAFSQEVTITSITTINCPDNRNGINQANDKAGSAPGHTIGSRRGNKGKGNGGESFNLYIDVIAPYVQERTVECISTANENAVGTIYIKYLNSNDYVIFGPTGELDPGM